MRRLQLSTAPAAALLALAACAQPMPTPSTSAASSVPSSAPTPTPSLMARPTRGPDSDLAFLLRTLEGTHPAPFHAVPREEFVAALETYGEALPSMTPSEAAVELMRTWAMLARERDGHQFAFPAIGQEDRVLPIRVYEFEEGLFITDALDPDLVGARVASIGGLPVEDVLVLVEPLVPRDGPATVPAFRPILLLRTVVLEGLGVVEPGSPIEIDVELAGGASRTVTLEPITLVEHEAWAGPFGLYQLPLDPDVPYLADPDPFTVDALDGGATLYLRYRFVALPDVSEARERIGSGGVDRLILDLRQNPGGDNGTYEPLLELVLAFAAERPGSVVVLTDRVTFSAAANLATEIDNGTDAVFVGEPMGGAPSFWDDVTWLELRTLPIPMRVAISTTRWQLTPDDDERLTIEPDVRVPVSAADHFAGRDPSLEAALTVGR